MPGEKRRQPQRYHIGGGSLYYEDTDGRMERAFKNKPLREESKKQQEFRDKVATLEKYTVPGTPRAIVNKLEVLKARANEMKRRKKMERASINQVEARIQLIDAALDLYIHIWDELGINGEDPNGLHALLDYIDNDLVDKIEEKEAGGYLNVKIDNRRHRLSVLKKAQRQLSRMLDDEIFTMQT